MFAPSTPHAPSPPLLPYRRGFDCIACARASIGLSATARGHRTKLSPSLSLSISCRVYMSSYRFLLGDADYDTYLVTSVFVWIELLQ